MHLDLSLQLSPDQQNIVAGDAQLQALLAAFNARLRDTTPLSSARAPAPSLAPPPPAVRTETYAPRPTGPEAV
jgi:hypothetical protein